MKPHSRLWMNNIVVKVGTSVLSRDGRLDRNIIGDLSAEIAQCMRRGSRVSVVSSGAIGAGMMILKMKRRPTQMQELQGAAAVGQRYLMQCYEEAFSKMGLSTAQVLLTWEDMANEKRYWNARHTLKQIQSWGLVPVINENDTVATDEIRFGDNDRLSSLLAILIEADGLIILSDTNGLYAQGLRGQEAHRIKSVDAIGSDLLKHVRDEKKSLSVGGMNAKLKSIAIAVSSGIPVYLADGRQKGILGKIFNREDVGTYFAPIVKKGISKSWSDRFREHVQIER